MSHCVEKLPHDCSPDKHSSDGLQVFQAEDGSFNGYCFSCGTFVSNPYLDKPVGFKPNFKVKSKEEVDAELNDISEHYQTVALDDRKLTKDSLLHFGIKVGLSERDGCTPVTHYYPYKDDRGTLLGYKVRLVAEKNFWAIGSTKGARLFGWQEALSAGSSTLFITEGELDAVALYQALVANQKGTKWESYTPAVVSLANGAGSAKAAIADNLSLINSNFKKVVLVFDNDKAGKEASEAVLQILPTALSVTIPGKDANDCVISGRSKALCNAVLFKAEVAKNTRLVLASSLHERARKQAEWGVSWPWKQLTELTRGIRLGETYYLGSGVKMGKSEVVNALAAHLIEHHKWKVLLAKPEEHNDKSYKLLAGKIAQKIFHDPKIKFDDEAYDRAGKVIEDNAIFIDLYQHMGWETLQTDIRVAATLGVKAVFIDPITNLVSGISAAEQNTRLELISKELSSMAKDLNIVVFIFCHLRAPDNGDPHERGGKVLSHQFAGSRAMMRSCNMMIGIEGNKDPSLEPEKRNIRKLVILEDREFGVTGEVGLYWNERNGVFSETV